MSELIAPSGGYSTLSKTTVVMVEKQKEWTRLSFGVEIMIVSKPVSMQSTVEPFQRGHRGTNAGVAHNTNDGSARVMYLPGNMVHVLLQYLH